MSTTILPATFTKDIDIDSIDLTKSPNVRAELRTDICDEYADNYRRNVRMPFPHVWVDPGDGTVRLSDGWHRIHGANRAEMERITCVVHRGGFADALAHALLANAAHGLRRSNADKRKAVELALTQWPQLSDRQLSEKAGVHHSMVATVRAVLNKNGVISCPPTREASDGRQFALPVTAKPEPIKQFPEKQIMPARVIGPIQHSQPPPMPKGLNASTVPLILGVTKALEDLWEAHPSWHVPAFRRCIAELRVVREDLQMEFPGFGEAKKRSKFSPPTIEMVRTKCAELNLPPRHAESFFNFYAKKGWKVGVNPMVNWELALSDSAKWESARVVGAPAQNGPVKELSVMAKEILKQQKRKAIE